MRKRCTRVARPTSTSSSPVANGSSVPAWPTFVPFPSRRRTCATTSCEVTPAGLSKRMTPSTGRSLELRGNLLAQERHQLVPRQRRREAGRLAVAAAALGAGDRGDVDAVVARAQRDLALLGIGRSEAVAHERGDRGALNRAQVVDDALGVVLLGAGCREVGAAEVRERQAAAVVALDLSECARQQRDLRV